MNTDLRRSVPANEAAETCDYCGVPFPTKRLLALHQGQQHESRLDERERARYERASEEESDELRLFRFKSLGGLVILYFFFLFVYAIATAAEIGFGAA